MYNLVVELSPVSSHRNRTTHIMFPSRDSICKLSNPTFSTYVHLKLCYLIRPNNCTVYTQLTQFLIQISRYCMAALTGVPELSTGQDSSLPPQPLLQPLHTETDREPVSPQQYTSVLTQSDGEDSTLRSRIPNSVSLEEAKLIQKEYEAPFKDLIHQNPIKTKDFKHPPVWFQNSPFSHNFRMAIGIFPALLVVLSLSGKPLLGTLSIGTLATYFTLNFSLPKHSLLVCLMTIITSEVSCATLLSIFQSGGSKLKWYGI